jgi:hypothetical protein
MLLATERKNGFLLFSENKFDFITNFTKVNKTAPYKRDHVDFKQVSNIVNFPEEKNIILYRLLTNDSDLDPFSTKLGIFIKIKNKIEVVYFDPIFIIKDLDTLKITLPEDKFRFKIQQVGYTTQSFTDEEAIFEERFAIDMSLTEAKEQNDSLFAETLLSFKNQTSASFNLTEIGKEKIFKKISQETESVNKTFYHIDSTGKERNTSYEGLIEEKKTKTKSNDFFTRVKFKNKTDTKETDSTTLKLFR